MKKKCKAQNSKLNFVIFLIAICLVGCLMSGVVTLNGCAKGVKSIPVPTLVPSPTPTLSPMPSPSPTGMPAKSATPTKSATPSPSASASPSPTPTMHWSVKTIPGAGVLNTIYFIDSVEGWAAGSLVGGGDIVLRTLDGGNNWTNLNVAFPNVNSNCIFFIDKNHGWMALGGSSPQILRTTNEGNTWTNPISPNNRYGIFFANSLEGWTCGLSGIVSSENGGVTWINTGKLFTQADCGGGQAKNGNQHGIGGYCSRTTAGNQPVP